MKFWRTCFTVFAVIAAIAVTTAILSPFPPDILAVTVAIASAAAPLDVLGVKLRLIDLKQIRAEKIKRSPAWFYERIAKGEFPKPLPLGNTSKNLWVEEEVDRWLANFVAKAKASGEPPQKRTAKASQTRHGPADIGDGRAVNDPAEEHRDHSAGDQLGRLLPAGGVRDKQ